VTIERSRGGMAAHDVALGLAATCIWAGAFLWTDIALRTVPPVLFAALRFTVTAAFFFLVPLPRLPWRTMLALAMLLGVAQHIGIFVGMALGVPPGITALLAHTQSFFTIALAVLLLGERLTGLRVAAFALAGCGLLLLIVERGTPVPLDGLVAVMLGAITAAIGNLILRRLGDVNVLSVTIWLSVLSAPPLFAISLAVEGVEPLVAAVSAWHPGLVGAVLYSGILSGIGAYAVWVRLFSRYETARVAPFMLLVPPLGIAMSVVATGERLSLWRVAAAVAILGGLAINIWASRRPRA
jgi:O-acetylserine/cysteine efflux transporter